MKILLLDKENYPNLSEWNKERVYKAVLNLALKANPSKSKKTITNPELYHSAKMLEMDLQQQFKQ